MADQVLTVLSSLSNQLITILSEEGNLLGGLRQEVRLITDEFDHMKVFLEVAESGNQDDRLLKVWIRQVREAADETRDFLDEFKFYFAHNRSSGIFGRFRSKFNSIKNLPTRYQLATKLQSIKTRIKNISEVRQRYNLEHDKIPANSSWRYFKDDEALHSKESQLVGIHKSKQKLISQLLKKGDSSKLKVITVFGMGGIGKTTLVKQVHDDVAIHSSFRIRVWVTVSQTYDLKELLKLLLRKLHYGSKETTPPGMEVMVIDELKELIEAFLKRGRYAIIFDDVWDLNFWEDFKFLFPSNSYGGNCVMLTTRIADATPTSCFECDHFLHQMDYLTFEESFTLFRRKTFGDGCCPPHLKDVAESLVRKCEGLPLAIVAISGVLASKDTIDEWEQVQQRIGGQYNGTGKLDRAKKILLLSYNDLPPTLKTCILCTSIYPEDYDISYIDLIEFWIAERLVEYRMGLWIEDIGWNYLKELANRSLIQLDEFNDFRRPNTVRIHDLMRDVILSESMKINFMTYVGFPQQTRMWQPPQENVRRLVCHCNHFPDDYFMQESQHFLNNLQTIITLGCTEPLPNVFLVKVLSSKFLKIVDLTGMQLEEIPKQIFNLFLLTHLSLRYNKVKIVPKSIKRLQNLEVLDLGMTHVRELPIEILKLDKLRKLLVLNMEKCSGQLFCGDGFRAPCNIGALLSLEFLGLINLGENEKTRIVKEIGNRKSSPVEKIVSFKFKKKRRKGVLFVA